MIRLFYGFCLILVGTIFGALGELFVIAIWKKPDHLVPLFTNWQTAIGGFVAIVAAFIGASAVQLQVNAENIRENERRQRRAMAVRAVLPLTLSEICNYTTLCSNQLVPLYDVLSGLRMTGGIVKFPSLSGSVIKQMQKSIEFEKKDVSAYLALMINRVQILQSRLRETTDALNGRSILLINKGTIESLAIDVAEIFNRAERLFDYARERDATPSLSISPNDVMGACQKMNHQLEHFDTLFDRIKVTDFNQNTRP